LEFLEEFQRRGADVSVPEIGSRGEVLCFGGILGIHAELRRELSWGNWNLVVFGFLGVGLRGCSEEGGPLVFLGEFKCSLGGFNWRYSRVVGCNWGSQRLGHG
jgi:hypothetical protein